jgi:hypothetical protein
MFDTTGMTVAQVNAKIRKNLNQKRVRNENNKNVFQNVKQTFNPQPAFKPTYGMF